jgi:hypothetical protein
MDAKTRKRVAQCNFSYFSAICAPDADPEGLRILCDWGNWGNWVSTILLRYLRCREQMKLTIMRSSHSMTVSCGISIVV